MKLNRPVAVVFACLLAACGGGSSSDETAAQDPQRIALRVDNSNTVEFPLGEPIAVTLQTSQRVHVTAASEVAWSVRHAGGITQGTGNVVQNAGVTVVEEATSNPSRTWSARVSGRTPSSTTVAFELVAETQPRTVITFYTAQ